MPGFFTRQFVKKAGDSGIVIAVDLQPEIIRVLGAKLESEGLMPCVRMHQCAKDSIGLSPGCDGKIEVAFAIFVVHELPDAKNLFREIFTLLKPGGLFFYSEHPFLVRVTNSGIILHRHRRKCSG